MIPKNGGMTIKIVGGASIVGILSALGITQMSVGTSTEELEKIHMQAWDIKEMQVDIAEIRKDIEYMKGNIEDIKHAIQP
jgi:short-subunit dehydrogenase involved in D-alanine esterification of teichoic acids